MAKIPPYPTSLVFRRRGINTIFSFYILTQIYIIRKTSNRVNGFFENNYKKFLCFSARCYYIPLLPRCQRSEFTFFRLLFAFSVPTNRIVQTAFFPNRPLSALPEFANSVQVLHTRAAFAIISIYGQNKKRNIRFRYDTRFPHYDVDGYRKRTVA